MKRSPVHMRASYRARILALAAAGVISTTGFVQAALQVGAGGLGVQTFNALPAVADWSTLSIAGGAGDITTADALDTAVINNTAASAVTVALTGNGTQPPAQNATPRWNSAGFYLQTRPTGNNYQLLMATLQNASGTDISSIIVSYDWGQRNNPPVNESVPGHRAYYSTTGAAGSWLLIPEFSNFTSTDTAINLSVTLNLGTWANGAMLYFLWVDDNGPGGTGDPMEGAYTIDNFAISLPGIPPSLAQQPAGQTNAEFSVITLSAAANGTPPLSYQWFRNGAEIVGATSSSLTVTNMAGSGAAWSVPSDTGNYHVVVTGSVAPPATSTTAAVRVLADTNAPRFLWAVVTNNPLGGIIVQVRLSERVASIDTELLAWDVTAVSGPGASLLSPDANATVVGNDIFLQYSAGAIDPATTYLVSYNGAPPFDLAQTPNAMTVLSVPLLAHVTEEVPLNHVWKYSDFDIAAPAGWQARLFDDSDLDFWKEGPGVFDAKRGAEGVPWCRDTALHNLGPVGTCITLSNANAAGAVATYYFRTHFDFSGDPASALLQLNGKFDDGGVVYLNGTEIWRVGLPDGTFPHAGYVGGIRTVGDTDAQDTALISSSALRTGDNVLAVEMRQVNATSSDATMGLRLVTLSASPGAPSGATMVISRNQTTGEVTITWGGGGTLERTAAVGPTANWQPVAGATSPYTFTPAAGSQGFYRVSQ